MERGNHFFTKPLDGMLVHYKYLPEFCQVSQQLYTTVIYTAGDWG